jgi:hypothetical protein
MVKKERDEELAGAIFNVWVGAPVSDLHFLACFLLFSSSPFKKQ